MSLNIDELIEAMINPAFPLKINDLQVCFIKSRLGDIFFSFISGSNTMYEVTIIGKTISGFNVNGTSSIRCSTNVTKSLENEEGYSFCYSC